MSKDKKITSEGILFVIYISLHIKNADKENKDNYEKFRQLQIIHEKSL